MEFLTTPDRFLRARRFAQTPAEYAASIERSRPTGYSRGWWLAMAAIAIVTLLLIASGGSA